uniref:Uncharacterized protein n=1 Tax=Arundo donax TaxID=35708 RepID=A0A0A8YXX3_ARUDO
MQCSVVGDSMCAPEQGRHITRHAVKTSFFLYCCQLVAR